MLWTTQSAFLRRGAYVVGLRISALSQVTSCAHGGGVLEEVTDDHVGSPERLWSWIQYLFSSSFFIELEALLKLWNGKIRTLWKSHPILSQLPTCKFLNPRSRCHHKRPIFLLRTLQIVCSYILIRSSNKNVLTSSSENLRPIAGIELSIRRQLGFAYAPRSSKWLREITNQP